ncbi:MAG: T9SS type A sorting domain-containing protein [Bacteroidales bacterium]|jgi:hypothetical protein
MKKLYTLFFLLIISQFVSAQEFSFQMYFEDAIGNKDTLTIGFDRNGTDTIDTEFGEVNLISIPLDTSFDVRISNEWQNRVYHQMPGTFHTKKQIIEQKECGVWYSVNSIDIFTDNWPVTMHWDSTLFVDTCLNGSLFTSVNPGGWWDTGGFREVLGGNSSLTFEPNYPYHDDNYGYINENNDTIDVFWQTFGDFSILILGTDEFASNKDFQLYPNPTINTITIDFKGQDFNIKEIQVLNMNGKSQPIIVSGKNIDLTKIPDGLYLIRLTLSNGETITKKIIKKKAVN